MKGVPLQKKLLCSCVFFFFTVTTVFSAESLGELASQLRKKKLYNDMNKHISQYLEDREEYLKNGIENGRINAREEKTIRRSLNKIKTLRDKFREKGSLSTGERKAIQRELNVCYRLIWFYSRKAEIFSYDLYGKKFYLKDPWQKRFQRSALSRKDMEEIMKVIHAIWGMRKNVDHAADKNAKEMNEMKKYILKEGEKLLLEKYFTLDKPEEKVTEKKQKQ